LWSFTQDDPVSLHFFGFGTGDSSLQKWMVL
jgi:hypothetical protein